MKIIASRRQSAINGKPAASFHFLKPFILSCEIARNIGIYLAEEAVGRDGKNHAILIEQDNCFIIQQIYNLNRSVDIFCSFLCHEIQNYVYRRIYLTYG